MLRNFVLLALTVGFVSCAPAATGSGADAAQNYGPTESIRIPHGTYYFTVSYPVGYLTGKSDTFERIEASKEFATFTGERVSLGNLTHHFKLTDLEEDKVNFRLVKVMGEREIKDRTGRSIYYLDHLKLTFEATTSGTGYSGEYPLKLTYNNSYDRTLSLFVVEGLN
ncbi:hypothetical protein [Deinococcus cellulosilyticus]|uniref:Uncharacterized protein n=1 Tax=Deinococcus cellulosilyticus (strain DSM 18568 / NBRC 106333 / KACC 11606 / 5516J-15) TaxID=1223518 RepID=A0A511MWZ4_DEIC1|nr:hypothetical protein [Deinococcus cellulosilyticus]GEM45102.1 hypothetical protein DC3_07370 [Deinococcus cellulosilyticus NBRC 106333 = KACC 11606]